MATVNWSGRGDGTTFYSAANWDPKVAPANNGDTFVIDGSKTPTVNLTLTATNTIGGFTVKNDAAVTFSGAYTLTTVGAFELDAGSTINLAPNTTIDVGSDFSVSGSGTATLSGGQIVNAGTFGLTSGQTLVLTGTTYSSTSPITGAGTLVLNGASATFSGSPPTVNVYFDTVTSGPQNILTVGNYATVNIQNFGYGDEINSGGNALKIVATGTSNGGGLSQYNLEYTSNNAVVGTVYLAPGTPGATGAAAGSTIPLSAAGSGDYGYPCFYPGTQLATADGVIAVEDIAAGIMLKTVSGAVLPVRWVGWTEVATRSADPLKAWPIRITAGALADGLPTRDLLVSPDHAIFVDDVLVQASALVNGVTITREGNVPERFRYYHVELATHELLLAEGVPAESFVDNVDRMNFHNWDARTAPREPIEEMPYARAKSVRQVPLELRQALQARAELLAGFKAA